MAASRSTVVPPVGGSSRGPLLVVAAAVCWGTGGLAGSVLGAQAGLSPIAVGAYRLAVAAVVLVGLGLVADRARALAASVRGLAGSRPDALRVVGVGTGLALFQVCYFLAVREVGVAVATLLTLGLAPVLVTGGAAALLGERVGLRLRVALPVALVGLALLVGAAGAAGGTPGGGGGTGAAGGVGPGGSPLAGALLACTSAVGYAAVTLLGRSLAGRVEAGHVTTLGFVVGAVVALPVGLVVGMGFAPAPAALALVAYLGVVPTALAYALFFAGLRGTASGTASVLTLAEPLTATVLAVLLVGERLVGVQWVGAVLLCAAVLVLSGAGLHRRGTPGAVDLPS